MTLIKILLIAGFFICLNGCTASKINYTIFLKEGSFYLTNTKGEFCEESGYQLHKNASRLTVFYKNCDIRLYRKLQEFEIKQWLDPLNKKLEREK